MKYPFQKEPCQNDSRSLPRVICRVTFWSLKGTDDENTPAIRVSLCKLTPSSLSHFPRFQIFSQKIFQIHFKLKAFFVTSEGEDITISWVLNANAQKESSCGLAQLNRTRCSFLKWRCSGDGMGNAPMEMTSPCLYMWKEELRLLRWQLWRHFWRANRLTQQVKVLTYQPDGLSSISEAHTVEEENLFPQAVLWPPDVCLTWEQTHMNTHTNK